MQLNLDRLDASGLDLAFGSDPARQQHITLGSAKGLRGTLSQTPNTLRLSGVMAEALVVSVLQLEFESFAIDLGAEGLLLGIAGNCERRADGLNLQITARSLHAPGLAIEFENVRLEGELRAQNVQLQIAGGEGRVRADALQIDGLEVAGSAALGAEQLVASHVDVSWGAGGYVARVGELHVSKASGGIDWSSSLPADSGKEERPASGKPSLVDWKVLDGLSGSFDVDVLVDAEVPVIGSRRARHPFRVIIESGSVNYRELERNLSALENSILDFAVRDGALVLERGLPLLPTRGRGKPLFSWPLGPDDLELASEDRVRLAVLPEGRPAASPEPKEAEEAGEAEDDSPAVALRELSFVELAALLRLTPIETSTTPFRNISLDDLFVRGTVHHRAEGEQRSGELGGQLRGLRGTVVQLPFGSSRLDLGSMHLGELTSVSVPFSGVHPQKLSFDLADLGATSLSFGNRSA